MARILDDKRSRLIRAAAELSHAHGLGTISLADIAQSADVPLGNVYCYFKTKGAIGEAVVAEERRSLALHLLAALQGVSLLASCFHDANVVVREARFLKAWIHGLG